MNDSDRRFEPVLAAMLEQKSDELRSSKRYWSAISDRMDEQDSRNPWDFVMGAMNKLRLPIMPRYAQTVGGALVVAVAALLLILFLNNDDGQSGGSAPASSPGQNVPESGGADPASGASAPVPTSTPAPTSTPEPTATTVPPTATAVALATVTPIAPVPVLDERSRAVEFLKKYEEAGFSYSVTVWGEVVHWLGGGDIAGGTDLWLSALEEFESVLTGISVPEEMASASEIRETGLSVLEASRVWVEGIKGSVEAGDFIEPLSLLVEVETQITNAPERLQLLELKEEFRAQYRIDDSEVRDECVRLRQRGCY